MIKPDGFQEAFLASVGGLDFGSDGLNVIAIDGKSLQLSLDKKSFQNMLQSVAAWSVANWLVLGCESFDERSKESTLKNRKCAAWDESYILNRLAAII